MRGRDLRRVPALGRLALQLPRLLRHPLTPEEAERIVAEALPQREARLLTMLREQIYAQPASPYRALLDHAGIAYGDAEALVQHEGVEGALAALAKAGVYLSIDEFKGRRPIRRGSLEVTATPEAFNPPPRGAGLPVLSGATRSGGTPTWFSLDTTTVQAARRILMVAGLGHEDGPVAVWLPILPGSAGLMYLLQYAKMGRTPARWFSQAPVAFDRANRNPNALLTRAILRTGRLGGTALPTPEYAPLGEAGRVAAWAASQVESHGRCQIMTYVSSAVRACAAAEAAGFRLDGVLFVVTGEALTPSRAATIRATGADVAGTYGLTEGGTLAFACGEPAMPDEPDDMHLVLDRAALILHPMEVGGREIDGLLLTMLGPHAPKVLLNFETGDTGRLVRRDCGCPQGRLGYTTHLSAVTSYEKLNGEGQSYDASHLVRIVEEVLPARFGGVATDYQAVEEPGANGLVHLALLVSPRLGPLDDAAVAAAVRAELRRGHGGHRLAELVWGQTDFLRVRRAEPHPTARGKLLPFHVMRPTADGDDQSPPCQTSP